MIEELKRQAYHTSILRKHLLGPWRGDDYFAISSCVLCGACACVNTKPLPNEIEVGGSAVAVNCPGPY